jgi:preprotein translocase subunit SecA
MGEARQFKEYEKRVESINRVEPEMELLDDAELRTRLGEAAEERARSFTWDRSASTFLEVLRRTAAGSNGAAAPGEVPSVAGTSGEARRWLAGKR